MEKIIIGEILKAQGIKGEIKVRALTDDSLRYKKLKVLYIDNSVYKILSCRIDGEFVYLLLNGIDDRDKAELLRNKHISIDKINSVVPDDGYLISDIIGCALLCETGEKLGVITHIDKFGAADVITVKTGGDKIFRFPFLNKVVKNIDTAQKEFVVFKERIEEVLVYEN